ncbi:MAG: pyruvate carboxylase [Cytophagales bacterium]|nr:pyruvate carboxylase [Bernardetiaceae bacterium]MDW8205280.1 pyruvate carboxylase [Cytophagales bacterium]
MRKIERLLVANRGEIAIRILRAASELHINTLAIYTYEDRYSLHRYKADEAYQIGSNDEPLKPYLDIEEIIALAKAKRVDAIHPGYGFLSENVQFARRCEQEGIIFVGPRSEVMAQLGDKVAAKKIALAAGVPMIEDSKIDLVDYATALAEARRIGFPVMLKSAAGGGGRGMRVVRSEADLERLYHEARNEAANAFGDSTVFLEKFIDDPKHIEVQIMGDNFGNIVHLYERDCSVQRRFQKVVEIAPSIGLSEATRQKLYDYALKIARAVNYNNVGTVEFLVDKAQHIYFIEVNPRVQVEHTVTEEITGIDIVRSQILIAQGCSLSDKQIYINSQEDVQINGYAVQCRITTEDPENGFKPDYGTIIAYRNAGGFGIRIDEGSSYPGVRISPFFDSMLVKVTAKGRTLWGACDRLHRALREFRIRGVKTNIGFLLNVIAHPEFIKGKATVRFIEQNPELFKLPRRLDRGTRLLNYLADVIVNGNPDVHGNKPQKPFRTPKVPACNRFEEFPQGSRDRLKALGRDKFIDWLKAEKAIHFTDTTFRDAHQSLLATRVRTIDMLRVAESYARNVPQVFSIEMWGGATFDVAMRFLKECPWERLRRLRQAMPNILFQMLLRGANAVGYKSYPPNLVEKFVERAAANGIDLFRIFDSLNWVEAMKTSIRAVIERTDAIAEGAICYTGEILNPNSKYNLQYYLDLARQLEDLGIHILAIKDMAGLLKPYSAELLISELKKVVSVPIHLHTHDTAGIQSATLLKAIDAGVDVIDVAIASMSGLTAQPNFNSIVAALQYHERKQDIDLHKLNAFATYWEDVREYYFPFESDLKASTAEVYDNEIPGGQYSNLRPQAISLGLGDKFEQVKKNYAVANRLLGDIVKVTPSSKVVGDLALFLTANNLTESDIWQRGHELAFPESVKELLRGDMGRPPEGFPEQMVRLVLKDEQPNYGVPGHNLPPIDFETEKEAFEKKFAKSYPIESIEDDLLSYLLYPKVYEEYSQSRNRYGDLSVLPSPQFFYGMKEGEEVLIELAEGKSIMVRLLAVFKPDENGMRTVSFELNGQTRRLQVRDRSFQVTKPANRKVQHQGEIGAPLQGRLAKIMVNVGDAVQANTPLFVIEAMKMESTITAPHAGVVKQIFLPAGSMVEQEDAIIWIV